MSATPNLAIAHILQNQAQKEVTANAALDALDQALTDALAVDCAAGGTVTLAAADFTARVFFSLTGAPAAAFTLSISATKRLFAVANGTG